MVSKAIEDLSDSDLNYLETLLGKEFAQQNERMKQFEVKNGWSSKNDTKIILRLLNAVRSQKKIKTIPKW